MSCGGCSKRHRRGSVIARALVVIAVLVGAATGCQRSSPEPEPEGLPTQQVREQLLQELRPVSLKNCTLSRFGSPNDGGYLVCANLIEDLGSAYSYGVGPNDEFGCDVSKKYRVPVHQYDCFDPARPVCAGGTFVFHNECIGPRRETVENRLFDTLPNQISANGDAGKRLIVKIDVEGAEWDALMATPDDVLARIDQLPMELHGVDEARFLDGVRRLKQHFHLVNINFNNWACSPEAAPLPGPVYQVLFVNKRIGVLDEAAPVPAPPSPLNALDNPAMPACRMP